MNNIDHTHVVINIPWTSPDETTQKVFEVHVKNISEAIRLNSGNYNFLEGVRKDFIFGLMEIEALQARLTYSDIINRSVEVPS